MKATRNQRAAAVSVVLLLSTACAQIGGPTPLQVPADASKGTPADQAAVAVAANLPTGAQLVPAKRGPITETLALTGRIAGREEVAVTFPGSGKVDTVAVKNGQEVQQGQLLLETDTKAAKKDLAAARSRLDSSTLKLQQLQAQVQARQSQAKQKSDVDRARLNSAVAAAEADLRRAEADQERIMAGASDLQKKAAQDAVLTAQANVKAGEADVARIGKGADPEAVRAAERDVAKAQSGVDRAQIDLDRLTRGPDPFEQRAAERGVDQAQNSLRAAEAMKTVDDASRVARDAAIANAKLGLQDAQERLAKLQQKPAKLEVDIATRNLQLAQGDLDQAQQRLDALRKGPDDVQLAKATAALETARTAAAAAQARLEELTGHPTDAEQRDAQARVAAAKSALDRAKLEAQPVPTAPDPADFDLIQQQRTVADDRSQVSSLEAEVAAGQLLSPFAGVVVEVQVRPGDTLDANRTLFILSKAGEMVMRADVNEKDAPKLAQGQAATIQLTGTGQQAQPLDASVIGLTDTPSGGRAALLSISWPADPAPLGTKAQATVTLQQKDNALLVPEKAVRSASGRRYVETMDAGNRTIANVDVGITAGGFAEIVKGLNDGQSVLVLP